MCVFELSNERVVDVEIRKKTNLRKGQYLYQHDEEFSFWFFHAARIERMKTTLLL